MGLRLWLMLCAVAFWSGYLVEWTRQRQQQWQQPARTAMPLQNLRVDAATRSVLDALSQKRVRLAENTAICQQHDVYGMHSRGSGWIDLCTARLRQNISNEEDYRHQLQRTIVHEAVHVAQYCQMQRRGVASIGLPAAELAALPPSTRALVDRVAATHVKSHRATAWRMEAEAHALEQQPAVVVALLSSSCG